MVDRALEAVHLCQRDLEERIEHTVHALGTEPLGQWRRIGDVAKQHRHLLAFAFERAARVQDAIGQVPRRVAAG